MRSPFPVQDTGGAQPSGGSSRECAQGHIQTAIRPFLAICMGNLEAAGGD